MKKNWVRPVLFHWLFAESYHRRVPTSGGERELNDVLAPNSEWILAGIREYLSGVVGLERMAQTQDKILDDLGLEGFEIPDFILELEERFGIKVPDGDVGRILDGTIGEAVEYVRVRLDAPIAS